MEQVVITKRKGTAPSLDEPQGRWAAVAFLTLALAVSACDGSSPTAPSGGPFTRELQAVSGNNQTGVSGEGLAEPFRVRVTDSGLLYKETPLLIDQKSIMRVYLLKILSLPLDIWIISFRGYVSASRRAIFR